MRRNSSSLSSAILLMLVGAFVPVVCLIMSIQFDQNCGGYLKQAADANTVELAKQRIDIAVKYMEDNHLTDGYTSVLWCTEGDNVGYVYTIDETTVPIDTIDQRIGVLKESIGESLKHNDLSMTMLIDALTKDHKGLIYRYNMSKSGRTFDVTFSPEEVVRIQMLQQQ